MKNTIARLLLPACFIYIQLLQITPSCRAESYIETEQDSSVPIPFPTRLLKSPAERDKLLKASLPSMLGKKKEEILNYFGRHNDGMVIRKDSPTMRYLISKGNGNYLQFDFQFDHGVLAAVVIKNSRWVTIH